MYKYEIEQELADLKPVKKEYFCNYLNRISIKENKIILFKNKKEKINTYYCTHCQSWHFVKYEDIKKIKMKNQDTLKCDVCNRKFKVIYPKNVIKDQKYYITLIDTNSRNELTLRIFFYYKSYKKDYGLFYENIVEVERMNIDRKIYLANRNSYRGMGSYDTVTHRFQDLGWKRDKAGYYNYYSTNLVYKSLKNVKKIMKNNSEYRYSCLDLVIKNKMDILAYLDRYISYPKIELMMKAGCFNFVNDMLKPYYYYYGYNQQLNNLKKEDMQLLQKYNLNANQLTISKKYNTTDINLIRKIYKLNGLSVTLNEIASKEKLEKTVNYLYKHCFKINDYNDYIVICNILGMDLTDKRVLYPRNPKKAHDKVMREHLDILNERKNKEINEFAKELNKYAYHDKNFLIRPAKSATELIEESKALHHCVRMYADDVAARKTSIMFIRNLNCEKASYVTLELKDNVVIQCRAIRNNKPVQAVIDFVNKWCKINHFRSCFDEQV